MDPTGWRRYKEHPQSDNQTNTYKADGCTWLIFSWILRKIPVSVWLPRTSMSSVLLDELIQGGHDMYVPFDSPLWLRSLTHPGLALR